jgi:hypothetical protein
MFNAIDHNSSLIFSVKTFRPLWIFSWVSSVWRQFPMRNSLATIMYRNKNAAMEGHNALTKLLTDLDFRDHKSGAVNMGDVIRVLEKYAKEHQDRGVKSYRIWTPNEMENKMNVKVPTKTRQ